MNMKDIIRNNYSAIMTAVFFLVVLIVGKSFDLLSIPQFLMGTLLFVILTAIAIMILRFETEKAQSHHLTQLIEKLDKIVVSSKPEKYGFILEDNELLKLESEQQCSEIWIITNDLANDVIDTGYFVSAIEQNIRKGIVYKYIVPDTDVINGKILGLKQIYRSHPKSLEIYQVSSNEIKALTFTDIAYFNPTRTPNSEPENIFARLPIDEFNYWIKYREDLEYEIKGKITRLFSSAKRIQ